MNLRVSLAVLMIASLGLVACSKDGGGGGQPAVPPQYYPPNNNFPNNMNMNNSFNSIDIVNNRIVNRAFNVQFGAGREAGEDSCLCDKNGRNTFKFHFMFQRGRDNFMLHFDPQGNLTVVLRNMAGEMRSMGPVGYFLNDANQSIEIEPFVLTGAPSQQYVNMEVSRGRISQRRLYGQISDEYGINNSNNSIFGRDWPGTPPFNGGAGGGFSSSYQPGQPLPGSMNQFGNNQGINQFGPQNPNMNYNYNPAMPNQPIPPGAINPQTGQPYQAQPGVPYNPNNPQMAYMNNGMQNPNMLPPMQQGVPQAGEISARFENGLVGYIKVNAIINPQHILTVDIPKAQYYGGSVVNWQSTMCTANSETELVRLRLL
jgi:hypothetical protein